MTLATWPIEKLQAVETALGWVPYQHQIAPPGDWIYWFMVAGRGSGKTDAGAYYVDEHVKGPACLAGPVPHRVAIAAPTLGDARLTCVKGESGLLTHNPEIRFVYADGELFWPNGSHGRIFGAFTPEDVERWRGPQHCLVWGDEIAIWRYFTECWTNMRLGLRLGPKPRFIGTTTPKPSKKLKDLYARPDAVVTRGKTNDNPSLAPDVRRELYRLYEGTRIGRQELEGEDVDAAEGALWTWELIESLRAPAPQSFGRIVVAVDPAVTSKADSDETGIVVVAVDHAGVGYVLDDCSLSGTPKEWATAVIAAFHKWNADRVVAETNNGGEMVELTLHTIDPMLPYKSVTATRGKVIRAEPIVGLYEQGRVRHVRPFAELEAQMTGWDPVKDSDSPDRMDALVWGLTEVLLANPWAGYGGKGKDVVPNTSWAGYRDE